MKGRRRLLMTLRKGMMMLVANGVVQAEPHEEGPRLPPPRRVIDEVLRAPVITGEALPMGDAVAVYGLPELAAVARRWVRQYSGRPRDEGGALALLTTEVFANAVRHSRSGDPGGEVIVTITKTGRTTQVKITDNGPRDTTTGPHLKKVLVEAGEGEHGGFGLRLVASMSTRWGVIHEDERTTVWFDIDRPDER